MRQKRAGGRGQSPPVLFSCSRFLNPRGPDYLGAWTRLQRQRHIIIIIISLFVVCLFVFSHSVWWWFLLFDKFRDTAPFIIFICISLIVKTLSGYTSISFILSFQSKSNKHNTFIIAKVTFLKYHPYECFVCLHASNNREA